MRMHAYSVIEGGVPDDGLQTHDVGAEDVARAQRRARAHSRCHPGSAVRGWNQEGRRLNSRRQTQLLKIPPLREP